MSSYSLRSPLALWQVSYHTRAKNPYREFPLRLAFCTLLEPFDLVSVARFPSLLGSFLPLR